MLDAAVVTTVGQYCDFFEYTMDLATGEEKVKFYGKEITITEFNTFLESEDLC